MYSSCRKAYKTNLRDVFLITYSKRGQNKWPIKPVEGSQINSINNIELSSIYINEDLHFASNFSTIAKQLCQKDQRKILSNIKGKAQEKQRKRKGKTKEKHRKNTGKA